MEPAVKHHAFLYPFFRWYISRRLKQHFHSIELIGNVPHNDGAILVISNHTSWWDGFWINYLNENRFQRKFTFLMREDQLQKHWYFKHTGGIPINKGSRSAIKSLAYCAQLLNSPNYLLLVFPQGEIQTMHATTFKFEKGIERIMANCPENVQMIFAANLIDYFSNAKPTLSIYYTEFDWKNKKLSDLQTGYQQFYRQAVESQLNRPLK